MKTKISVILILAVAALAVTPKSAHAGDKELALIGGLVGGIIIGNAIQKSRPVYETQTHVVYQAGYDRHDTNCAPGGGYEMRVVRVWVPACWETQRRHGRVVRVYVPGYYVDRRERVWVAYNSHGGHSSHGHNNHNGRNDRDDRHDRHDRPRSRR